MLQGLEDVIEKQIRPALIAHGGDIRLVEVTPENDVTVQLLGACASCPGAQDTMHDIVETALRDAFPQIREITLDERTSPELIEQAMKILRGEKL